MPTPSPSLWIHDPHDRWPELSGGPADEAAARLIDGTLAETMRRLAADGGPAPVIALVEDEAAAQAALADGADGVLTRDELAGGRLGVTVERARASRAARRAGLSRCMAEVGAARDTLESFGRSVSHDLRAPLRAIDGFGQALLEDYGDDLDPLARRYVERIRAGAARLGDRLTALLRLSEMVRRPLDRRTVDLGALADGVIDELRHAEPERVVRWQRDPDLTVVGDGLLLRRLIGELVQNAWRFSAPRAAARVELRRRGPAFVLRDDGVGFGPSFSDRIFHAFSRFHTEDEFPGAGVGLAVARCAVERHGGRIAAHGQEGGGAVFAFTLGPDLTPPTLTDDDLPPRAP